MVPSITPPFKPSALRASEDVRQRPYTTSPRSWKALQMANPMPRFAPVTATVCTIIFRKIRFQLKPLPLVRLVEIYLIRVPEKKNERVKSTNPVLRCVWFASPCCWRHAGQISQRRATCFAAHRRRKTLELANVWKIGNITVKTTTAAPQLPST